MGFSSVADRVQHRLPRPIKCDNCGSPRIALQKRSFIGMRTYGKWDLVWHCGDCFALVGCHEGTDIPMGLMADALTRDARHKAHKVFDELWRGRRRLFPDRASAYVWFARVMDLAPEAAHISMLDERQCEKRVALVEAQRDNKKKTRHWSQDKRKRRNK